MYPLGNADWYSGIPKVIEILKIEYYNCISFTLNFWTLLNYPFLFFITLSVWVRVM